MSMASVFTLVQRRRPGPRRSGTRGDTASDADLPVLQPALLHLPPLRPGARLLWPGVPPGGVCAPAACSLRPPPAEPRGTGRPPRSPTGLPGAVTSARDGQNFPASLAPDIPASVCDHERTRGEEGGSRCDHVHAPLLHLPAARALGRAEGVVERLNISRPIGVGGADGGDGHDLPGAAG